MTKKQVRAIARELDCKCNEPFMFISRVGRVGTFCHCQAKRDFNSFMMMMMSLLESMAEHLPRGKEGKEVREEFITALIEFLSDLKGNEE